MIKTEQALRIITVIQITDDEAVMQLHETNETISLRFTIVLPVVSFDVSGHVSNHSLIVTE
jgi:hypothetical protein